MNEEQQKLLKAALDKQAQAELAIAQVKLIRSNINTMQSLEATARQMAAQVSEEVAQAFVDFEKSVGLKREVLNFWHTGSC